MKTRRGFTLIEILVVVAIIALLISILLPSLNRAREQSRRTTCSANEQQIMKAGIMYAEQDTKGIYIYSYESTGGNDSLFLLYPKYLREPRVAICPSTRNVIRPRDNDNVPMGDLKRNGGNADVNTGGHSYEMRTWMWADRNFNGFASGEVYYEGGTKKVRDVWKSAKNVKRPFAMMLFGDADDEPEGKPHGINNWPDIYDNHGADGVSLAYCDGHAEWTRANRRLVLAYLSSYYDPGLPETIYTKYSVTHSGTTFKW